MGRWFEVCHAVGQVEDLVEGRVRQYEEEGS